MAVEIKKNWKVTFGAIWSGQIFSLLGSALVQFSLVWWLTQTTGSATILATASLVAMLPQVIFGPFAGAIVDRANRRLVMIFADAATAIVTLVLVFITSAGMLQPWHVYVAMFLRSLGQAFHWPAMQSSTSMLVPDEQLSRIAGINQALQGIVSIVAPPLGAVLLGAMALNWVLSIDIITAMLAILPLLFIAIPNPVQTTKALGSPIRTILNDTGLGFKYVWKWKGLFYVVMLALLINFLTVPGFSLMALLVQKHFHGGALQYGWIESAFGIGVIVGGITLGVWGGFKKKVYTSASAIIGLGLGSLALGMAASNQYWLGVVAMAFMGIMNPICNGPFFALMQSKVDADMQGRVMSMVSSLTMAVVPIAMIFAGPLSDRYGIQTWFVIGGICCVLVAIAFFTIREVVTIEEQAPGGKIQQPVLAAAPETTI